MPTDKVKKDILPVASTEAEQAKKFDTPPPAEDPASLSGARDNPLYLGPTNFAQVQKQYTPYQVEQATSRDKSGNIFWKKGVNIKDIPTEGIVKPVDDTPVTGTDLKTSSGVQKDFLTEDREAMTDLAKMQSEAAGQYLDGITKKVDEHLNKLQEITEQRRQQAEDEVKGMKDKLRGFFDTTQARDSLKADRELFKVKQTADNLNMVKEKIADATAALNQGLIYEESRPVRMQLLTGRMNTLKQQGMAQLGAMQATAEILQNNLTLASSYADQSLQAISEDNNRRMSAITTLLELENNKLIKLDEEEKNIIDARMTMLKEKDAELKDNKEKLMGFMMEAPMAAASAGVTFLDTPEEALRKMLPHLSAREKAGIMRRSAPRGGGGYSGGRRSGGSGAGGGTDMPSNISFDDILKKLTVGQENLINGDSDYNPETGEGNPGYYRTFLSSASHMGEAEMLLNDYMPSLLGQIGESGVAALREMLKMSLPPAPTPEEVMAEAAAAEAEAEQEDVYSLNIGEPTMEDDLFMNFSGSPNSTTATDFQKNQEPDPEKEEKGWFQKTFEWLSY